MGVIRHELVVLESFGEDFEEKVNALRAEMPPEFARLLVGPVVGATNGVRWFALFPDGSKEYWCTSEGGVAWREKFKALCPYPNSAVHVACGDEDPGNAVASWACDPDEDCRGGRV